MRVAHRADAMLFGHSGSTSAHPIIAELTRRIRAEIRDVVIIYGGVFPTYHFREVLAMEPQIDVIVRGEGEDTAPKLDAPRSNPIGFVECRGHRVSARRWPDRRDAAGDDD